MATNYTHAKYTVTISNMRVPFNVKKEIHPCMTTVLSVSLVMKIFSQRCTIEFFNGLAL